MVKGPGLSALSDLKAEAAESGETAPSMGAWCDAGAASRQGSGFLKETVTQRPPPAAGPLPEAATAAPHADGLAMLQVGPLHAEHESAPALDSTEVRLGLTCAEGASPQQMHLSNRETPGYKCDWHPGGCSTALLMQSAPQQ